MNVAGRALTKQFTQMGPSVLPISEQVKAVASMALAKTALGKQWGMKPFIPDFKRSIDHFCIHAGGRAVIEGVQKNLKLSDIDVEPSFMTLKSWGNTSSIPNKKIKNNLKVRELNLGFDFYLEKNAIILYIFGLLQGGPRRNGIIPSFLVSGLRAAFGTS